MKKVLFLPIFTALILFLSSCAGGTIKVVKDDFKNASIVQMDLGFNLLTSAKFTREFTEKNTGPAIATFYFISPMNKNLDNKIIFKAGDKNYDLTFAEITGEIHTDTDVRNNFATGKKEVSTSSYKKFVAKIIITNELEQALTTEKQVSMRIYYENDPDTYKIASEKLLKIKNFLLSTPEKIADEKSPNEKTINYQL